MTSPTRIAISTPDPLLAAVELRYPVDLVVLQKAIIYRESLIDQLRREIEILQRAMARLPNQPET